MRLSILDIPQQNARRFPPARLHNGEGVEAGGEHVLGGTDAHGVAGEGGGDGGIDSGAGCGAFDHPADRGGVEGGVREASEVEAAKEGAFVDVRCVEPFREQVLGSWGEPGDTAVAGLVAF